MWRDMDDPLKALIIFIGGMAAIIVMIVVIDFAVCCGRASGVQKIVEQQRGVRLTYWEAVFLPTDKLIGIQTDSNLKIENK